MYCLLHRLHVVRAPVCIEPVERVARLLFAEREVPMCVHRYGLALCYRCVFSQVRG